MSEVKQGLTRRDFLKTSAVAAGAVALGLTPEGVKAQNSLTDYSFFTHKDFEKLGFVIASQDVEQQWKEEIHPEIATIKTKDAELVGLEITMPLALMARAMKRLLVLTQSKVKQYLRAGMIRTLN